ncbi:MAG: undecaprenyl-diphosphate phosphatase [Firmicutes bacterium]|nr:undecaprenyl-diphosphate phosphatase [Bacillota bacterium]
MEAPGTLQAVLLGTVQGFTEFLPVSSSGHLVIVERLLGVNPPGILFEVSVHLGTLLSLIVVFHREMGLLLGEVGTSASRLVSRRGRGGKAEAPRASGSGHGLLGAVILGTIPAAVTGLLFKDSVERLFESLLVVGLMLLVTGTLLYAATSRRSLGGREGRKPRPGGATRAGDPDTQGLLVKSSQALTVGLGQAMALAPGLSRSGTTISVGMLTGLQPEASARFSFILAIPAVLGASIITLGDFPQVAGPDLVWALAAGTLAAAISGYVAILLVFRLLRDGRFRFFAYYAWAVGAATVAASLAS